jgi:hypothetical protein
MHVKKPDGVSVDLIVHLLRPDGLCNGLSDAHRLFPDEEALFARQLVGLLGMPFRDDADVSGEWRRGRGRDPHALKLGYHVEGLTSVADGARVHSSRLPR